MVGEPCFLGLFDAADRGVIKDGSILSDKSADFCVIVRGFDKVCRFCISWYFMYD